MSDIVKHGLNQLRQSCDEAEIRTDLTPMEWMSIVSEDASPRFWRGVRELHDAKKLNAAALNRLLNDLHRVAHSMDERLEWSDSSVPDIGHIYRTWNDPSEPRYRLLVTLAQLGGSTAWSQFAELIATDPPTDAQQAVECFLPLWRRTQGPAAALFPRLLDGIEHLSVAAIVLDLANYFTREGRLAEHPAALRTSELTWLMGQLVERLEACEETSHREGVRDLSVAQNVQETIALTVSLSDTLVLLNHRDATGKLYRMLGLQHRRLRVEAAAGLAKLGEDAAADALCEMAAEPLVRLRVHAYATELGIVDKIRPDLRSPEQLAESEVVIRLAEPDLFGFAPSSLELVDARDLHWPGYEEIRRCYLFRFAYHLASGEHANIAIVGPVAHALVSDVSHLDLDDVYAVYAGWNVQHDELRRVPYDPTDSIAVDLAMAMANPLSDLGYAQIEPAFWGEFFGERLLVATARYMGGSGTIVASRTSYDWFSQGNPQRPIDADLAYSMFVGRQLLRRFNDSFSSPDPSAADVDPSTSRQA